MRNRIYNNRGNNNRLRIPSVVICVIVGGIVGGCVICRVSSVYNSSCINDSAAITAISCIDSGGLNHNSTFIIIVTICTIVGIINNGARVCVVGGCSICAHISLIISGIGWEHV